MAIKYISSTLISLAFCLIPVKVYSSIDLSPASFNSSANKHNPTLDHRHSLESSLISPIENPNLLDISGPNVTLHFKQTQAKQAFKYLSKLGKYGFVWVQNDPTFNPDGPSSNQIISVSSLQDNSNLLESTIPGQFESSQQIDANSSDNRTDSHRLITLSIHDKTYSQAFNALLMASGLQAKLEDGIIYVGPNVRDTVFVNRFSSVYQLNQISASSAADYLANLGASITKTYTINTSITEGAIQSQAVQGSTNSSTTTDQSKTEVSVYGSTIGPLLGLVATTDERLQTITMVGDKKLVQLASTFLSSLDQRQLQVALTVQVLDLNLSNSNELENSFAFLSGESFIISETGKILSTFGKNIPSFGSPVSNPGLQWPKEFANQLSISLRKGTAKVLAKPTLILSEYSGVSGDGSIGRKYGNEGFIEVGDKVPVNAEMSEGTFCTLTYDLVGIKLGARVLGIDKNGFVTFTMSPSVTGVTEEVQIPGCGTIKLLNTRRLETGSIRVKDNETLILTGVLQDSDSKTTYKLPLLGDIPLLGSVFQSTNKSKERRELVILVTPRIIYDKNSNNRSLGYIPRSKDHKDLLKDK